MNNIDCLNVAKSINVPLRSEIVFPKRFVSVVQDKSAYQGYSAKEAEKKRVFGSGEEAVVDFGEHLTGYFSFTVSETDRIPDSPCRLEVILAETPYEFCKKEYSGTLSSSWLQRETVCLDVLPQRITLPRRYAFRYVSVKFINSSEAFSICIDKFACERLSSGGQILQLQADDNFLLQIDRVSQNTLRECMQEVFEDGPKRDRRLWLGDLYLQAKANYRTFKNNELVKKCIYLFAGLPQNDRMSCCVFSGNAYRSSDYIIRDYSLLFAPLIKEYCEATGDGQVLELYPIAKMQNKIILDELNGDVEKALPNTFIDWSDADKTTSLVCVLIFALDAQKQLAQRLRYDNDVYFCMKKTAYLKNAVKEKLFIKEKNMFISNGEYSMASQIWAALAGVAEGEEALRILLTAYKNNEVVQAKTPYLMHYFVEALLLSGGTAEALQVIKEYWGGMVEKGADTFWEVFDRENDFVSPYGDALINSYCHAWSSTPCYFLRDERIAEIIDKG